MVLLRQRALSVVRSPFAPLITGAIAWNALPVLGSGEAVRLKNLLTEEVAQTMLFDLEGVVASVLTFALGTVAAQGVFALWQRQVDIRRCLLKEFFLLEVLTQQLVKLFRRDKPRMRRAAALLERYNEELSASLRHSCVFGAAHSIPMGGSSTTLVWAEHWRNQQSTVLEMSDLLSEVSDALYGGPLYGFSPSDSLGTNSRCTELVFQLAAARNERRAFVEGSLPSTTYLMLSVLMASLLYCFVLRAGPAAAAIAFFSIDRVRLLFAFMCSAFSSIFMIMADLHDPFRGNYRIDMTPSVTSAAQRIRGAKLLAWRREPFEENLETAALRPDMRADDNL